MYVCKLNCSFTDVYPLPTCHLALKRFDGVGKYFQLKVKIATLKESANKLFTQVRDSLFLGYMGVCM